MSLDERKLKIKTALEGIYGCNLSDPVRHRKHYCSFCPQKFRLVIQEVRMKQIKRQMIWSRTPSSGSLTRKLPQPGRTPSTRNAPSAVIRNQPLKFPRLVSETARPDSPPSPATHLLRRPATIAALPCDSPFCASAAAL